MRIIQLDGQNARVWSADELQHVENVVGARASAHSMQPLQVATDGSPIVGPFNSPCHPIEPLSLASLRATYIKAERVLVLRCNVCGRPALIVAVQ